ncbi:MAG TPA: hypothetical protein VFS66_09715 [Acidimicrobiia bacterium]|nr:hypothetical protein [Acidimicrobiia bacterium]
MLASDTNCLHHRVGVDDIEWAVEPGYDVHVAAFLDHGSFVDYHHNSQWHFARSG